MLLKRVIQDTRDKAVVQAQCGVNCRLVLDVVRQVAGKKTMNQPDARLVVGILTNVPVWVNSLDFTDSVFEFKLVDIDNIDKELIPVL